jgi:hypothetical protein
MVKAIFDIIADDLHRSWAAMGPAAAQQTGGILKFFHRAGDPIMIVCEL